MPISKKCDQNSKVQYKPITVKFVPYTPEQLKQVYSQQRTFKSVDCTQKCCQVPNCQPVIPVIIPVIIPPLPILYKEPTVKYVPYTAEQRELLDKAFPKPKKIIYSHARPPIWEFRDEISKRKKDVQQEIYKEALKLRVNERKKHERIERKIAPWKYI